MEHMEHKSVGCKANPTMGLSATALRLLAIFLMLLDHMWATVIPGNNWMTYLGRLAFPIFAFQLVEGFVHTSDLKLYKKRMLIAALISEIPFNLMMSSSVIDPFHQNVMFTFWLGLRAMEGLELIRQQRTGKAAARGLLRVAACLLLATIGFVDYHATGVFTVLLFYVFRGFPFARVGQLITMVLLHIVLFEGMMLPLTVGGFTLEFPVQGFAVLALLPIWFYSGKKGRGGKGLQIGSYLFYPAHMLLLHLIRTLF